jgi:beta-lactamase regulating signal transducer with metallopeptidase domain
MIPYLLNTTLCALLLYAVYALLLEKEKMHRFKRMYLLVSLVFSLTIPLITVNLFIQPFSFIEEITVQTHNNNRSQIIETKIGNNLQEHIAVETGHAPSLPFKPQTNYPLIILSLYGLVTALFLFRLLKNSFQLLAYGRKNPSIDYFDAQIVLIKEKLVPHSFWKYIFVNQDDYENERIAEEIIIHEWAHVKQKHSLDIVFLEVLIAFFWFNPIYYLYKKKIKLNHEFIADDVVIKSNRNISNYQMLLINRVNQQKNLQLASNFNYLITKKRLIMMTKTTTRTRALCKIMALIPVFIIAVGIFSTKTVAQNVTNALPENTIVQDTLLTVGKGVSQELLDEYKAIESKYYETSEKISKGDTSIIVTWKTFSLPRDEWERLYAIYIQMDKEQRWIPYIGFASPLTPHLLRSPNKDEWKGCKNADIIWLDGKRVDNSALQSYNRHDITFFTCARDENGQRIRAVWTKKGYEEYLNQYEKQISISKLVEIEPTIWFATEKFKKPKPDQRN